jgi:pimeloyl-ACP methyl ester carboxylesterase
MQGTIGQWKRDTLAIFDALTQGEVILVGSSMGGWLSMLVALARPERVKALVGVASAPDFTERLIWKKLTPPQQEMLLRDGVFYAPSCYGEEPYPITRRLIEEAREHLLLDKTLPIACPTHLLHGTQDADVPVDIARMLAEKLPQSQLTLIDGGNHRLSEPSDLALLCRVVDALQ